MSPVNQATTLAVGRNAACNLFNQQVTGHSVASLPIDCLPLVPTVKFSWFGLLLTSWPYEPPTHTCPCFYFCTLPLLFSADAVKNQDQSDPLSAIITFEMLPNMHIIRPVFFLQGNTGTSYEWDRQVPRKTPKCEYMSPANPKITCALASYSYMYTIKYW